MACGKPVVAVAEEFPGDVCRNRILLPAEFLYTDLSQKYPFVHDYNDDCLKQALNFDIIICRKILKRLRKVPIFPI